MSSAPPLLFFPCRQASLRHYEDVEVLLAFLGKDVLAVEKRGSVDDILRGGHLLLVDLQAGNIAA